MIKHIGIIVIGRNEGSRLKKCLQSVLNQVESIVYVDSGSSDDSVSYAKDIGIDVIQLDMSVPFSAGRARNEGFEYLIKKDESIEYIQFIDGDCKLSIGWIDYAKKQLKKNPLWAIVAGQVREKDPYKSLYNRLCDIEWNTPNGEVNECGGIFMIRKSVFKDEGGFNQTIIAGEEPELCYRLKKKGWKIYRLDCTMAMHDAKMVMFSQWWKRAIRSGHGYAHGYFLHRGEGDSFCRRESLSIWFWACILPFFILFLVLFIDSKFLLLTLVYPIQVLRVTLDSRKRIGNLKYAFIYAIFDIVGKCPQLIGQLLFVKRKLSGQNFTIIEYS